MIVLLKIVPWLLSLIGIVGAVANIYKDKRCFFIWNIGNVGWMLLAIWEPMFRPQLPLWAIFTILNFYGYRQWTKDETNTKCTTC